MNFKLENSNILDRYFSGFLFVLGRAISLYLSVLEIIILFIGVNNY